MSRFPESPTAPFPIDNFRECGTNHRPITVTSESVSEGHPDKVCDFIADSVVDAYLTQDPNSRVACEVLCKRNLVVVAGEITSRAQIDYEDVVREAIGQVGYTDAAEPFCADTVQILLALTRQSQEIGWAVDGHRSPTRDQGAGDQGIMFGYATDETPELMPLPIVLAHALTKGLADDRRNGMVDWLRPDSKAQVSVVYQNGRPSHVAHVVVSTQHERHISEDDVRAYVCEILAPHALGRWFDPSSTFIVNPSGSFVEGGPFADCGVTGRKIIVDSYGGVGRHGGGAFSGKDPSKVDRSAAYFCRYVARALVASGLARRAELQVSYAIGQAAPVSVTVDTFGTGDDVAAARFVEQFDLRPGHIIRQLDLLRPIYRLTTNYGHFGRPDLPWEKPLHGEDSVETLDQEGALLAAALSD
jgi:S-adenosylmethionine synthetase